MCLKIHLKYQGKTSTLSSASVVKENSNHTDFVSFCRFSRGKEIAIQFINQSEIVTMGSCQGALARGMEKNNDHPHGGPPGQRKKNSPDRQRRGSDDSHGKGHGNAHGHKKH